MPSATLNTNISVGGIAISASTTRTKEGVIGQDPTLPAGKAGSLTTRTDDDTGVATLAADHGILITDTVDVYWSGGVRYGMTVTAVNGAAVSINLGAGDNLPTEDTAVIVTPRVEIDVDFDGDLVELIVAQCPKRAHIEFLTSADASIKAVELPANEAWSWVNGQGVTNPLASNVVGKIQATCGDATDDGQLKLVGIYDSVS